MFCFLLIFFLYLLFLLFCSVCIRPKHPVHAKWTLCSWTTLPTLFCYSLSLGPFNNFCTVVTKHLGRFAYNIVIQRHTEKPPLLCTLPLLHPSVPFLCPPWHSCCFGGSSTVFTVFNTQSHLVRVVLCCVHSFLACAASNTPRRRKNKTEQI